MLQDGRIAAQGAMTEVLCDRALVREAHLKVPLLLELGLAMREAFPGVIRESLPISPEQLLEEILRVRQALA